MEKLTRPIQLNKEYAPLKMLYAYLKTPIGMLQITEEDASISSVLFVDEEKETPTRTDLLDIAQQQLSAYFEGNLRIFDLPIQQSGTHFQQSVWQNLRDIAYGETISYSALAKRMQNKLAIRAIASTNGKNKILIIVPCHRVIGLNGEMTGYAGGINRKQWLLNLESERVGQGQRQLDFNF